MKFSQMTTTTQPEGDVLIVDVLGTGFFTHGLGMKLPLESIFCSIVDDGLTLVIASQVAIGYSTMTFFTPLTPFEVFELISEMHAEDAASGDPYSSRAMEAVRTFGSEIGINDDDDDVFPAVDYEEFPADDDDDDEEPVIDCMSLPDLDDDCNPIFEGSGSNPYRFDTQILQAILCGTKLLDVSYPSWQYHIDVSTLDLKDPYNCVLGQLYPSYETGLVELGLDTLGSATAHGFSGRDIPDISDYFDRLTELWVIAITYRQGTAHASHNS
jgi:hypothetical protein